VLQKRQAPAIARALRLLLALGLLIAFASSCVLEQIRQDYAVEVVTEGQSWDEQGLASLASALDVLPEHIVDRLGNRHYGRLHVLSNTDGTASDGWQPYGDGANFYSNAGERNELVLLPHQSVRTILHELGHAYQMREVPADRYAWVFFQSELREFMAATGWELLSTDEEVVAARSVSELQFAYSGPDLWDRMSNEDPVEDYANSFALYFDDPEALERLSPERYEFIATHVARDDR
jgi:hypothetical protein